MKNHVDKEKDIKRGEKEERSRSEGIKNKSSNEMISGNRSFSSKRARAENQEGGRKAEGREIERGRTSTEGVHQMRLLHRHSLYF